MIPSDKLDEFHYHELLDRLHVIMTECDSHLLHHPVTPHEIEVEQHIQSALNHLMKAYQIIGNKAYERFTDETN